MDYLGNVLNLYVELLISGRGRRAALLEMVGDELEKLWGDSGDSYLSELFDKYYTDDGVSVAGVHDRPATDPDLAYLLSGVFDTEH